MIRAFRLMTNNLQEIRNQGRKSQTPLLCRSIAPKILQERFISLVCADLAETLGIQGPRSFCPVMLVLALPLRSATLGRTKVCHSMSHEIYRSTGSSATPATKSSNHYARENYLHATIVRWGRFCTHVTILRGTWTESRMFPHHINVIQLAPQLQL
jgi:hypothetical protein